MRAADFLADANADVLSVQHEYGIFGGPDGSHLLPLLERARMPVVTTLHTVLERPSVGQRRVMDEIVRRSARLVVMTRRSQDVLEAVHGVPRERVALVPHGIPDTPFLDPKLTKGELGAEGRTVLLTFGLLSPGKGIEHAIRAMPAIVAALARRALHRAGRHAPQSEAPGGRGPSRRSDPLGSRVERRRARALRRSVSSICRP